MISQLTFKPQPMIQRWRSISSKLYSAEELFLCLKPCQQRSCYSHTILIYILFCLMWYSCKMTTNTCTTHILKTCIALYITVLILWHVLQPSAVTDLWSVNKLHSEAFALVGCCTEYVGSLLPTFRDNTSGPSSRSPFRWDRYVARKRRYPTSNTRYATSQKGEDVNWTMKQAWKITYHVLWPCTH
jgi:hypothetical protein